jgi:hypothetical protein
VQGDGLTKRVGSDTSLNRELGTDSGRREGVVVGAEEARVQADQDLSAEMTEALCKVLRPHIAILKERLGGIALPWTGCDALAADR